MSNKLYYKHSVIYSQNQQDVEDEINVYNTDKTEIVSVNVTPIKVKKSEYSVEEDDFSFPLYEYHISIVYKERE